MLLSQSFKLPSDTLCSLNSSWRKRTVMKQLPRCVIVTISHVKSYYSCCRCSSLLLLEVKVILCCHFSDLKHSAISAVNLSYNYLSTLRKLNVFQILISLVSGPKCCVEEAWNNDQKVFHWNFWIITFSNSNISRKVTELKLYLIFVLMATLWPEHVQYITDSYSGH